MILKELYINQFRNYKESKFTFSGNVNVLYGKNGIGKTNILEAIYMLGRGVSFKSRNEREIINYNIDYSDKEKGYSQGLLLCIARTALEPVGQEERGA